MDLLKIDPPTLVQLTSTDPEVQEENETEEEVSQALPLALLQDHTPNPNSNYHSGRSSFRCSPSIHGYPLISFSRLTSKPQS